MTFSELFQFVMMFTSVITLVYTVTKDYFDKN